MGQRTKILKYLLAGNTLTPLEALQKFGCMRLGARIWELREMEYGIKTETISKNGKRYASYKMEV